MTDLRGVLAKLVHYEPNYLATDIRYIAPLTFSFLFSSASIKTQNRRKVLNTT